MASFKLSEADFAQVADSLKRFSARPRDAARRVLVAGETLETVSGALLISKEAVRKSADRVAQAWLSQHCSEVEAARTAAAGLMRSAMPDGGIPKDWEPVVVYLPARMAKTIRELENQQLAVARKTADQTPLTTQP